ncbi:hypothetical protein D3C71_972540 [compost metagenome]
MQQQHRAGIRQDVLLTLQRMARLQRQVHRPTAQDRHNPRIQCAAFWQADSHHQRTFMLIEQRLQSLLDCSAESVQLAIVETGAGNVQRPSLATLNEALFKSLDHRYLSEFQQPWFNRRIAAMNERQAFEKQQVFNLVEVSGSGGFAELKILGIPGVTADQQRHVIHQFRDSSQTQRLTVARRFIGDRHTSEQRGADGAKQVQRGQSRCARLADAQLQCQVRRIIENLHRQAGIIDHKIRMLRCSLIKCRYPCQCMTVLFEFQRQVGQGLALSSEQNVETSHDGFLVKSGSRSRRFARTANRAANCCGKTARCWPPAGDAG